MKSSHLIAVLTAASLAGGCSSPRPTTKPLPAASAVQPMVKKDGEAQAKRNGGLRPYSAHDADLLEYKDDDEPAGWDSYLKAFAAIESCNKANDLSERAKAMRTAQLEFVAAAGKRKPGDGFRDICILNAAKCAAALGDHAESNRLAQTVPIRRDSSNVNNWPGWPGASLLYLPVVLPGYILSIGNWPKYAESPHSAALNHARQVEVNDRTRPSRVNQKDHLDPMEVKVSDAVPGVPGRPVVFAYSQNSPAGQKFEDVDVELEYFTKDRWTDLSGLRVTIKNRSQRVVPLTNMAARITIDQRTEDLKVISADSRVLPNATAAMILDVERVNAMWNERTEPYPGSITVYDIPVKFDSDVGEIKRKENVTWNFTITPGITPIPDKPAVFRKERNPATSYTSWDEVVPGIGLIESTKSK